MATPRPETGAPNAIRRAWTGLRESARELLVRAKNEHSAPHEVGFSVAAGVFSACTPFLGFHMWIALALATVFRLNRLWAFLGSRVSIVPVYLWISFCEIELGHRLRAGEWVRMSAREPLAHGKELSIDWAMGTVLVGGGLAAVSGVLAYGCVRRWSTGRVSPASPAPASPVSPVSPVSPASPVSPRRLGAPLERSSESPPSEPRGSSS